MSKKRRRIPKDPRAEPRRVVAQVTVLKPQAVRVTAVVTQVPTPAKTIRVVVRPASWPDRR
jgi:hypothetical protein